MAYIGANWPDLQAPGRMVETFTVNAGAGPYTLTRRVVGGDPADIEVFIDNVRQQPTTAYTIGGTGNNIEKQITFTAAPTNGIAFYVVHVGPPVWESAPADSSVTNTKLAPSSITGHTAETTVADDDVILMYDTSASVLRKITRANFKTAAIAALKDADNNTKIQVEESADENKIRFDTAGTERMIIAADGKVGIGTTAPSQKLTVSDAGTGNLLLVENTSQNTSIYMQADTAHGKIGTLSNHQLDFMANNSKKWSLNANGNLFPSNAAHGIVLGNTSDVAANRLDDYEEGTFTPTIQGQAGASGQSYSNQFGAYTKVGRLVALHGYVTLSNKGTISGNYVALGGFPFANMGSGADGGHCGVSRVEQMAVSSGYIGPDFQFGGGASLVIAMEHPASGSAGGHRALNNDYGTPTDAITNDTSIAYSCTYMTA